MKVRLLISPARLSIFGTTVALTSLPMVSMNVTTSDMTLTSPVEFVDADEDLAMHFTGFAAAG